MVNELVERSQEQERKTDRKKPGLEIYTAIKLSGVKKIVTARQ